jgi:membrane-associated phospholipid phosphatase
MQRDDTGRWRALVKVWLAAMMVAILLDGTVAAAVRASGVDQFLRNTEKLRWLLKAPGEFWPGLLVAGLLLLAHPLRHKAAGLVLVTACVTGINTPLKWLVGRTRPFKLFDADGIARAAPFELEPFRNGLPGALHLGNLSFPSGHAACAFAAAMALSILLPRWRRAFYAVAVLVAAERVLENGHWLSDVVAGAALGVGGVVVVRRLWWDAWAIREEAEPRHGRNPLPLAGDPGV